MTDADSDVSSTEPTPQTPSINVAHQNPIFTTSEQAFPDKYVEHALPNVAIAETNDEKRMCGLGSCHLRCMQSLVNLTTFSVFVSAAGIANAALSWSMSTQLTSIEKQFNLTATTIGLFDTVREIGSFLPVLFLGYIARRVHVPRWVSFSTFLYGMLGLMCIIPYIGTRHLFLLNEDEDTHVTNSSTNSSDKASSAMCCLDPVNVTHHGSGGTQESQHISGGLIQVDYNWHLIAKFMFLGVMFLQGICIAIRFIFLPVFVDDNVEPGMFAKYMSIMLTLELLFTPFLSMGFGAAISKVYVTLQDTNMQFTHPNWISAWWLGFVIFGTLSVASCFPLLLFPRQINVKKEIQQVEQKRKVESEGKNKITVEIKGFINQILKLCLSPLFIILIIGTAFRGLRQGSGAFSLQFKALYFGMDQSMVNLIEGIAGTILIAIGLLIGSYMSTKFRFSAYDCLRLKIAVTMVLCGVSLLFFMITCDQPRILASSPHPNPRSYTNRTCSTRCICDPGTYFPVCGNDGNNYYSPCDAGCKESSDGGTTFIECACMGNSTGAPTEATGGLCDRNCNGKFWIFLSIEFFYNLIEPIPAVPFYIAVMRSVDEEQKPMALSLWNFFFSVFGTIPGPIIFGKLVDTACLVVNGGGEGACLLYDMSKFRFFFIGWSWLFQLLGGCAFMLGIVYIKCCKNPERYMRREKDNSADVNAENDDHTNFEKDIKKN